MGKHSTIYYEVFLGIITSPVNIILFIVCFILIFKIFREIKLKYNNPKASGINASDVKKQDMTLKQLHAYDGHDGKSILIAVNGKIFDVTQRKDYYGPEGPYGIFAGRDVTRSLAKFSLAEIADTPRDLSDLSVLEMESVKEWELQFKEKYFCVGRLIAEDEESIDYSANELAMPDQVPRESFDYSQPFDMSPFDRFTTAPKSESATSFASAVSHLDLSGDDLPLRPTENGIVHKATVATNGRPARFGGKKKCVTIASPPERDIRPVPKNGYLSHARAHDNGEEGDDPKKEL